MTPSAEGGFFPSLRDTALVARMELSRSIRTWRALALVLVLVLAVVGADLLFVGVLKSMENALAVQLGVPPTDRPGAMLGQLLENGTLREMLSDMVGDPATARAVLDQPVMALFHFWICLLLCPFFAATSAAECVSVDLASRAIRYEVVRTGRLEVVMGRFLGQVLLTLVACGVAVAGTWIVGVTRMVGQEPLALLLSILAYTPRVMAWTVPFIGMGVAASQLTTSPAWARVLSLGASAGTWMAWGLALAHVDRSWGWACDILLLALPQGWMLDLWRPDGRWLFTALVCGAMGLAAVGAGFLRFARRDL